jgi:(2R)-3-sulfolactate dehydrogenase (NADP+)
LIIAFDPEAFGGGVAHSGRLAAMIAAQPGARLPGSRRLAARARAQRDGLAVSDALLREIEAL